MAVFDTFKIIPKFCFECYKVVVLPRTVAELFKLLMVFEKIDLPNDNWRKCMTEGRPDCSGAYKGFVYCRGIQDGKAAYKIVRKVVSEEISPQLPVDLKRGCSEYAQVYPAFAQVKFGKTSLMSYRNEWQAQEEHFDNNFIFRPDTQDGELGMGNEAGAAGADSAREIFAMRYWLAYAATIGDASYLKIAGVTIPPVAGLKRPPFKAVAQVERNR
jgi:hypothetical protein